MTHTYDISGMTCTGCTAKVKGLLEQVPGVLSVNIDLSKGTADIGMAQHIATDELQQALKEYPKYKLSEQQQESHAAMLSDAGQSSWWVTYKPILLIFGYLTGITLLLEFNQGQFHWDNWMNNFMAGFFLVFSFFKMLDLKGFAESYFSYDIIARKWMGWGYVYPFIELLLGLAYLYRFSPVLTNGIAFVVMTLSIIGVLQSVFNKRKIKCACLGAVFNLPMSTITIIEDALMIVMSGAMFLHLL